MAKTIETNRVRATHPVDEVLPIPKLAVYGFQHVLAFYAGAVIVPILLASAIGLTTEQLIHLINADLFTCGIASIIQSVGFWKIGVRLPLLQGVTFTAVSPMIAIGLAAGGGTEGLLFIYGAVIVAGLFTFLIAPYFAKLIRFFPPVVTGTVITIIGIALLPVAAVDAVGGGRPTLDPTSGKNLAYAMGTLALIVIIQRVFKGFMATVAVLVGLVIGTAVAWILGDAHFDAVATSAWFGVTTPFFFGMPKFSLAAIISMIVVMLITAVETTGDVFATGEIVEKRIGARTSPAALRADGLATFTRRRAELLPLHLLRRERRPGPADPDQEPLRGRRGRRVHDPARADPEGRRDRRQHPAPGARRRGAGHVRHRGRGRHPDPVPGRLPRPPQRRHRRHQPRPGHVRHRAARRGQGGSGVGADHLRQRHHPGQPDRDPAEPGVPPRRQELRTGRGRHPGRRRSGWTRSTR